MVDFSLPLTGNTVATTPVKTVNVSHSRFGQILKNYSSRPTGTGTARPGPSEKSGGRPHFSVGGQRLILGAQEAISRAGGLRQTSGHRVPHYSWPIELSGSRVPV